MKRLGWKGVLLGALGVVLLATAGAGLWVYGQLRGSLPQLDGRQTLAGLDGPVTVLRDALGVPTLRGESPLDVVRALGFVHAQDRFFQMDLLRRRAAGELAQLFGKEALELDREVRLHRFRHRAETRLSTLPPQEQRRLEAYTRGVNAALATLDRPPFEYLLLGDTPRPWRREDSLLAIYAMYLDLQGRQWQRESAWGVLADAVPEPLAAFLNPPGSPWDAPLIGPPFDPPILPGPEVVNLRDTKPTPLPAVELEKREIAPGSNNWAVAGRHSARGGALLAGDMHLGIQVPNTWYRASLAWDGRRITGVTLPGTPAVTAGSNARIAWAFTNSYGDWSDLVIVEPDPDDPDAYRTPAGSRPYRVHREIIRVRDGDAVELEVRETLWGPVVDRDHRGRPRALRWVAHDPEGLDTRLTELEEVDDLDRALTLARQLGVPSQNILVADRKGRIGWTLTGPIPRRFGHDGRRPASWADGKGGWDGWLAPETAPRIADPESGRLWTANSRTVNGEWLDLLGDGGYVLGARARQIRDALVPLEQADEKAMLDLQLDDRALFLAPWRELLLETLDGAALEGHPRRRELRQLVVHWQGRAAVDAVGYRLVRGFRLFVEQRALEPLVAPARTLDGRFELNLLPQREAPLWQLVTRRPLHLLDSRYESWEQLLLEAADALIEELTRDGRKLAERPWGERNSARFQHPFSRALPWLGPWLDLPESPLPGDLHMPRVQTRRAGASQRLVVSPGQEEHGLFHMPGGQSGHPLSPHYRDGHQAWVEGRPTPFLPGETVHTLTLVPQP